MSKKKKENLEEQFKELLENIGKLLDESSDVDKDKILTALMGDSDDNDDNADKDAINRQYYYYKRPIYKFGVTADWLKPFDVAMDADNVVSLCEYVEEECKALPLSTIRRALRAYLYGFYTNFDKKKEYPAWAFYGPLWLLERKQLTDCLDIVLEALRQDAYFFGMFVWTYGDYFSAVLYQLGHEQVPMLAAFLRENGLVPMTKSIVFDALVWVAMHDTRHRLEAVSSIVGYLDYCYDICMQGAAAINIDHYAFSLATAHVTEALPILQKIYRDIDVPVIELIDGIQEVEKMMGDAAYTFPYEHDNLNDYLQELVYEGADGDSYGEMPYDDFEYNDDDYSGAYISLCDDRFATEKYTVTVTLMNIPEKVERVLEVPSNIFLAHLAKVVTIAFGRKKMNDNCFSKNSLVYDSESNSDYGINPEEQTTEFVTLAELLNKRRDVLPFFLKVNKTQGWEHHIVLNRIGTYEPDAAYMVRLVDGQGTYPPASCTSKSQYQQLSKQGKLRKPNFDTVRKNLEYYEEDISSEII